MVLLLVVYVIQHALELTWAHRKCAVTTLPRKAPIPRINGLDPFRRGLLYLFDELSLRKSSWQAGNNVNVIRHAVYAYEIGAEVAAHCCEIGMHARSHVCIEPGFTIFPGEDDVNDELAERLGHNRESCIKLPLEVNRAFSADGLFSFFKSWGVAPGWR